MPKKPTPTTDLHPDSAGRPMDDSGDLPHNSRWNGEHTWERTRRVGENTEITERRPEDAARERK